MNMNSYTYRIKKFQKNLRFETKSSQGSAKIRHSLKKVQGWTGWSGHSGECLKGQLHKDGEILNSELGELRNLGSPSMKQPRNWRSCPRGVKPAGTLTMEGQKLYFPT